MATSKLDNPIKLGSHLLAQTKDGMLTSAMAVLDERTGDSIQSTINGYREELDEIKVWLEDLCSDSTITITID